MRVVEDDGERSITENKAMNGNDEEDEVDAVYNSMINTPKSSLGPSRKTRLRSETLQRVFSRSQKHISSSWRNDDYRKMAKAGLLAGGNIIYNGTQTEKDFFRVMNLLVCFFKHYTFYKWNFQIFNTD